MIVAQREMLRLAQSELTVSRLEIERYKLMLAKARREQYGQSSERARHLIEQLELAIEDLELPHSADLASVVLWRSGGVNLFIVFRAVCILRRRPAARNSSATHAPTSANTFSRSASRTRVSSSFRRAMNR